MVSVGLRTAFNEHLFGEPEQDANTALTELDKGKTRRRLRVFKLMLYTFCIHKVCARLELANNVKQSSASPDSLKNIHFQS